MTKTAAAKAAPKIPAAAPPCLLAAPVKAARVAEAVALPVPTTEVLTTEKLVAATAVVVAAVLAGAAVPVTSTGMADAVPVAVGVTKTTSGTTTAVEMVVTVLDPEIVEPALSVHGTVTVC